LGILAPVLTSDRFQPPEVSHAFECTAPWVRDNASRFTHTTPKWE
jgi:hypothetical protein